MVTGTMYATNPDELEVQLEVCMTLREWKYVKKALTGSNVPAQNFAQLVQELIEKYEGRVYAQQGDNNGTDEARNTKTS